jgi:phosphotransferase system IIB component
VFISDIGGKDNIISYKSVGSRLSLELKDYSLVDKEALKADNIDGIIEMSNKIVLVKEDLSEELSILESTKRL